MKQHIKFIFGVSLVALALAGCGKKEKTEEAPKSQETAQPVVTERPSVVCDDIATKNRVVGLVQDELLVASIEALGNPKNLSALEQHLKSRLAQTQVDVQNIRYENGECHGELHISLDPQDVAAANKAFKTARVASLDERALENGVSLLGDNRLVANFVYQVDGNAVAINTSNPAILVASKGLAQATIATYQQNQATARRDSGSSYQAPNITPPPTVAVRPAPVPRPVEPQMQRRTPTPETAVLRPEDVPSRETQPTPTPSGEPPITDQERSQIQAQSQPKPQPKAEPKPEPKPQPKAEPKAEPKSEPKPAVQDTSSEITIVESNETY